MADIKADNKKPVPAKPVTGKSTAAKQQNIHSSTPLFGRENYKWMLIGIVIMALGLLLMAGGKSKDPNVFDPKQVYSFTRITLAPILILGGLALEIVAIFKKNKKTVE